MDIQVLNDKLCEVWEIPKNYEVHYTYFDEPEVIFCDNPISAHEQAQMLKGTVVEVNPKLYLPENLVEVLKIINDVLGRVNICSAYTGNGQYIFEEYVFIYCLSHLVNNEDVLKLVKERVWK